MAKVRSFKRPQSQLWHPTFDKAMNIKFNLTAVASWAATLAVSIIGYFVVGVLTDIPAHSRSIATLEQKIKAAEGISDGVIAIRVEMATLKNQQQNTNERLDRITRFLESRLPKN